MIMPAASTALVRMISPFTGMGGEPPLSRMITAMAATTSNAAPR